jgi:hypothetical protein
MHIPRTGVYFFSSHGATAHIGPGPPHFRGFTITGTRHSGRVISPTQKPLPDYTHFSQKTDIHAPGEIRTRNPSKRAAADPRLRHRGHWDRHLCTLQGYIY